jgi:hypothetical protein
MEGQRTTTQISGMKFCILADITVSCWANMPGFGSNAASGITFFHLENTKTLAYKFTLQNSSGDSSAN